MVANLHETLLNITLRTNHLNLEVMEYQTQIDLATTEMAELNDLRYASESQLEKYYENLYEQDPDLQAAYDSYEDIKEFQKEMDKLAAKYDAKIDEITKKESELQSQQYSRTTEITQLKAYKESFKSMLTSNISETFKFGSASV